MKHEKKLSEKFHCGEAGCHRTSSVQGHSYAKIGGQSPHNNPFKEGNPHRTVSRGSSGLVGPKW
jgi:hypothetical protein